ncbi:uncharacterized protein LOC135924414 [Gordionus sp. m RMFG-2023]|uniref:uncharacterized protein LOC135924414 n=1 Tax=Gordionus sp. m RMFG-2023 TaxID=3053472 RepID=UPI0031FC8151
MKPGKHYQYNKQIIPLIVVCTVISVISKEIWLYFMMDIQSDYRLSVTTKSRLRKNGENLQTLNWSNALEKNKSDDKVKDIFNKYLYDRISRNGSTEKDVEKEFISFDEFESREKDLDLFKKYVKSISEDEFHSSMKFKKWGHCILPILEPFHPSINSKIRKYRGNFQYPCKTIKTQLVRLDDGILRVKKVDYQAIISNSLSSEDFIRCFYRPILRDEHNKDPDNHVYLGRPVLIGNKVMIGEEEEFLYVYCNDLNGEMLHEDILSQIVYKPMPIGNILSKNTQYFPKISFRKNLHGAKNVSMKLMDEPIKLETKEPTPTLLLPEMNVLMLGIDSVSRINYHRQMIMTEEFIGKNFASVEFEVHHKVGENTLPNLIVLLMGQYFEKIACGINQANECIPSEINITFDERRELVWKYFQQKGYYTLFGEDTAQQALFRRFNRMGFTSVPVDYYYRPMSLHIRRWQLINDDSFCAYGDMEPVNLILWVKEFCNKMYQWGKPYFAFTFTNKITHMETPNLGFLDRPYLDLLTNLSNGQVLNNTAVFLFSDHGSRFDPFRKTFHGSFEERLPILKILMPRWFPLKYSHLWDILKTNAQILTSHFDLYRTLIHLSNPSLYDQKNQITEGGGGKKEEFIGQSLFIPLSVGRRCQDAGISIHHCACNINKILSPKNPRIKKLGRAIAHYVNKKLVGYSDLCIKWTFKKVQAAKMSLKSSSDLDITIEENLMGNEGNITQRMYPVEVEALDIDELSSTEGSNSGTYILSVILNPNGALFEGTLSIDDGVIKLIDDVTRINVYGTQSWCIKNYDIQPYCFCKYPKPNK